MAAATRALPAPVSLSGGTFAMAFSIDACPVTTEQSAAFVRDSGYLTVAERPLNPAGYPGAPPENLLPGSLVFPPRTGPVDLRHLSQWWAWTPGACWSAPEGPGSSGKRRADHPVMHLCADIYCPHYRPAAHRPQPVDTGMSHGGFRCVRRPGDTGNGVG